MGQHETAFLVAAKKSQNTFSGVAQNKIGARGGAVADTQPDDFGSATEKVTSLRKIRVFAYDGEAVFGSVLPDLAVGSSSETAVADMGRIWVDLVE